MADVYAMPPRGHYLAQEVGLLAGVSGDQIGQWARRGYMVSSQSEPGEIPRMYSYQDILEAMVLHELVERNVSPRAVLTTVRRLGQQLETPWPLQQVELLIPPDHPRAKGKKNTIVVQARGQQFDVPKQMAVLDDINLEQVAGWLQRGGWAARELPDLRHIEVDPDRLSGRPAVRGTRVRAEQAGALAMTNEGREILFSEYGLTEDQVKDARRWWEQVIKYAA